jgi:hypothetical protein
MEEDVGMKDRYRGMTGFFLRGAILALFIAVPVCGHNINTSYTTLIVRPDTMKLMVVVDEYDLLQSFDLDGNQDGVLWREEMLKGVPDIFDFIEQRVALEVDGRPLVLERSKGTVQPDDKGNMFVNLFFRVGLDDPAVEVEVVIDFCADFGETHKNLAKILRPGKPMQQAVFAPENPRQKFVVGEREESALDQLVQMVKGWFE